MQSTAFGLYLRHLREQRGLSLRELGQLCAIDHAYIHRLEKGEKTAPSAEVLEKLTRVLKASPRDSQILLLLAKSTDIPTDFAEGAIDDPSVSPDEFSVATSMAFRSKTRADVKILFKRARKFLDEDV